jgi:sarcosine oxidase
MRTAQRFDIVVVGGGAVGLAAAYYAGLRGKRVLLLEQHDFIHDFTASSGASRQFRVQYNDRNIAQLVLDSVPLWQGLQQRTAEQLQQRVGSLWFGDPCAVGAEGQIDTVLRIMEELEVPYERLSAGDVMQRFGFRDIERAWVGFFQPDGAATNVKATLAILHRLALDLAHVTLRPRQRVVHLDSAENGVRLETSEGSMFLADRLIVCPGPDLNEVVRPLGIRFKTVIWEMVSAYFRVADGPVDYPTWINFVERHGADPGLYYGFPEAPWEAPGFVKVAANYPDRIISCLHERAPAPNREVVHQISSWVRRHMPGLDPAPVNASSCVCALFTDPERPGTLRHEFVLDFAPPAVRHRENIVICAAGWVFKLAPLLGTICADLAIDGSTRHDISCVRLCDDMWSRL